MKYLVTGVAVRHVSVEVEAGSVNEAIDIANDTDERHFEVWDSTLLFNDAEVVEQDY